MALVSLDRRRAECVTGTDIGRILGLCPASWGGPDQVLAEKIGLRHQLDEEPGELGVGSAAEEWIAARWSLETGHTIRPAGFELHPSVAHVGGTPDFRVVSGPLLVRGAVVEVKTNLRGVRVLPPDGTIATSESLPGRRHNLAQVLWYAGMDEDLVNAEPRYCGALVVASYPAAIAKWWPSMDAREREVVARLVGRLSVLRWYPVPHDPGAIAWLYARGLEWWARYIDGAAAATSDQACDTSPHVARTTTVR